MPRTRAGPAPGKRSARATAGEFRGRRADGGETTDTTLTLASARPGTVEVHRVHFHSVGRLAGGRASGATEYRGSTMFSMFLTTGADDPVPVWADFGLFITT